MDPSRKRLFFRAHHMGSTENDSLFGPFADEVLPGLTDAEVILFEQLLAEPDPDLYAWATGVREPPPEHDHGLMARLREFVRERG